MPNESPTSRWKDLAAVLTVTLAALSGLLAAWKDFRKQLQGIDRLDPMALVMAGGLFLVVAAYLQRDRLQRRSKLLKPDALRLHPEKHFVGREEEVGALVQKCSEWPLIWLVGESGAGKSTLLQYGLLPRLEADPHRAPTYLANWGVDWIEGPLQALAAVLPRSAESGGAVRDLASFEKRLRELAGLGVVPVLLFDQFDDYQARHVEHFRESFTLLSPELLTSRNPFWRLIRQLLGEGIIRCLFATRNDTAWALESIRFQEPKVQFLERLPPGHALELLEALAVDGVVRNPQNGFDPLKLVLAEDLEQSGRGLPVQMKVAFQGLRRLKHLTPGEYRRQGGLVGLELGHVLGHLEAAAQFSGFEVATLRPLLLALVNPVTRKTEPKTEAALLALLPEGSRDLDRLRQVLSHLEEKEVVRPILTPGDGESWQLDHDYLSRAVLALEERESRWQKLLDESVRSFDQAPGPWARKALLPPFLQIRLLWERVRHRLLYGRGRWLALWSSPRLLLNLLVLLAVGSGLAWQRAREEKTAEAIFNAFETSDTFASGLSDAEINALWRLTAQGVRVRRLLYQKLLDSDENVKRFLSQPASINNAALGLHSQQDLTWIKDLVEGVISSKNWSAPRLAACSYLVEEASRSPRFSGSVELEKALIDRMEKETDAEILSAAAHLLGSFGANLSQENAVRAGRRLIGRTEKEENPASLSSLAIGLGALGPKLDSQQAFGLAQRLVARMEKESSYPLVLLARGLGALGPKLDSQQAFGLAQLLVARIEKEEISESLSFLASGLGALGPKLDSQQAFGLAQRLVARMEKEENPDSLSLLAIGLGALGPKLDPQQAFGPTQRLVARMEKEENLASLFRLAGGLGALGPKLDSQQAFGLAQRLVARREKEEDPSSLSFLASGLGALGPKLDSQQAFGLVQRLVARMEKLGNPNFLEVLARVLPTLKLEAVEKKELLLCEIAKNRRMAEVDGCAASATLLTTATRQWAAEDLLKWPTCGEAARVQIVRNLATLVGNAPQNLITDAGTDKERINRWEVAAWLQQKGFDTDRPPKRGVESLELCQQHER